MIYNICLCNTMYSILSYYELKPSLYKIILFKKKFNTISIKANLQYNMARLPSMLKKNSLFVVESTRISWQKAETHAFLPRKAECVSATKSMGFLGNLAVP